MFPDSAIQVLENYPGWSLPLVLFAVILGAALQTAVGFGFALVAAPVLLFVDPGLVPVPITLAALLMTMGNFAIYHSHADWRGLGWIGLGNIPGYWLGGLALTLLPVAQMAMLFGVLTLAMVGLSISHLRFEPSARWQLPMGILSGFSGITTSMNGPPIALTYQHAAGPRVRGTLSVYFFLSNLVLIGLFAMLGKLDQQALQSGLLLVPGVLLGLWFGRYLTGWLDAGRTRRAVLWVSAISAVAVMVRYGRPVLGFA
jgi:uncharacterized membrane protein YfcA